MNREVSIVLPYPPSANRYFRVFRGRAVQSSVAKEYKDVVKDLTLGLIHTPWEGPIILHLDVFRPQRSGDLSNTIKVLEDALKGIVYVDDSQVIDIHPRRFDDRAYPRAQLRVVESYEPLPAPPVWSPPPGWSEAMARMEAVKTKEREKDKARAAKREANKTLGITPTPAYRKGGT